LIEVDGGELSSFDLLDDSAQDLQSGELLGQVRAEALLADEEDEVLEDFFFLNDRHAPVRHQDQAPGDR